ncbi:MAG: hypothetical protein FD171_1282 [Actinobacteria bacterium]|nr:MAG: hypothetical protein FD171_1282 [Actinomycetota bacterium]
MLVENRIGQYEFEICAVLSSLAYHIHPAIVLAIQERNSDEADYFKDLFSGRINIENYLFEGSACVFPGVRRYISGRGTKRCFNPELHAIIDDNEFPRHIWCYLDSGRGYSGPLWRDSGLGEFELAHVFTHKESEVRFETQFFSNVDVNLLPHGDFTCACNVVLLPKGTVRPTDNSAAIKAAFYQRYIDLYGEAPLNGRVGFRSELVPTWYESLVWIDPPLPADWSRKIEALLRYRTKRITQLMMSIG